jgi:hypothetical protein
MVAGYLVLDELGPGRQLIRITTGERAGTELVLIAGYLPGVPRLADLVGEEVAPIDADGVAERLLLSLLDRQQRAEWDALGTFCVETPWGRVRLGRLYDIAFKPSGGGGLRLCVVPDDHLSLPLCDIWANLLLVLRGDPAQFFRVANWQREGERWHVGPVPLDQLNRVG